MNEEIALWEAVADRHEREWKELWGSNPEMGPLVYWRDVVPYKILLKRVRENAGQLVCWGAFDCTSKSVYTKCASGQHDTCNEHASTCLQCKAAKP